MNRIRFGGRANFLTVDNKDAAFNVSIHSPLKTAMYRVIFQHVRHIINRQHIIYTDDFNVVTHLSGTKNKATDTSEPVNTKFNHK